MVTRLTIAFVGEVTIGPGAFELISRTKPRSKKRRGSVQLQVASSVVAGRTRVVLTFVGPGVVGGSLPDGEYTLLVRGDRIRDALDRSLAGDRRDDFFRLFGDGDGDGDVDFRDRTRFRSALGTKAGDSAYLWYFDHDGDGDVDKRTDLRAFMERLGRMGGRFR
jgi:hypothetical protein